MAHLHRLDRLQAVKQTALEEVRVEVLRAAVEDQVEDQVEGSKAAVEDQVQVEVAVDILINSQHQYRINRLHQQQLQHLRQHHK